MKHFALTVLSLFALLPVVAQQQMELTATEVAKRMMPGWNLGNTMEAGNGESALFTNNPGLSAETYWQDTKTTQAVVDYVKAKRYASLDELMRKFGVSSATIHRDVAELVQRDVFQRVRGGVAFVDNSSAPLKQGVAANSFRERADVNKAAKEAATSSSSTLPPPSPPSRTH